jgi:UDP-N-acetylglucosamine 2-epimerase (non-hydrolysing)
MNICIVVGARPNFMKMAPLVQELQKRAIPHLVVHTGQHFDRNMSEVFFEELELPFPDLFLGVGGGSHAEQTARIMTAFEKICQEQDIKMVVVGGDVNSTLACALVAAKLGIPVAHVEAGLRSFDRSMPEEINRIVTDHLSELLFTTEESANQNLRQEGIPAERIHFVGNCMMDTLYSHLDRALQAAPWRAFGLEAGGYGLLTLHRPANVDNQTSLGRIVSLINKISPRIPLVFPVHPRTRERLSECRTVFNDSVIVCEPLPYLVFLGLMARARLVLTDSGGIQEETTVLGVPCLTLRPNTERPVTLSSGTNRLVGSEAHRMTESLDAILAGEWSSGTLPPLWDGKAAERIVNIIDAWLAE